MLVTGMEPQTDLIRELASVENWKVTCEGVAGEMTVLRLAPRFWASADSEARLYDKLSGVATTTSFVSGRQAETSECDVEPPTTFGEDRNDNPAMAFGTPEMLEPYLTIAKSCGFGEAALAPVAEADQERMQTDFPADWVALYAGPQSTDRYGPNYCYVFMSFKFQDSTPAK